MRVVESVHDFPKIVVVPVDDGLWSVELVENFNGSVNFGRHFFVPKLIINIKEDY